MIKMIILARHFPVVESEGYLTIEEAMDNYESVLDTANISPDLVMSVTFVNYQTAGKETNHG